MSDGKRRAAQAALALVEPGMRLGLGTGSTAGEFVRLLAVQGHDGPCVATSEATAGLARTVGLTLAAPEEVAGGLDLCVDGADEIDPQLNLIKGGGAALLREKIVAAAAARFVVIADASKRVARLGRFPLPVEIAPFGADWTAAAVRDHLGVGVEVRLRRRPGAASRLEDSGQDGWGRDEPVRTDNGNLLLDCAIGEIADAAGLARALEGIPGVMGHGLFLGMAHDAFVAGDADVAHLRR